MNKYLDVKVIDTPIGTNSKLDVEEPSHKMNEAMYREIVESILYLIISRPDIMFSVRMYTRFITPREGTVGMADTQRLRLLL